MNRFIVVSAALIPLAACSFGQQAPTNDDTAIVTERPETKNVIYRGTLMPLGTSIYMEGSHRLQLEDGRFVLLESDGLILDEYLNEDVEVFGSTRATIEGSSIIMRVERVANLAPSSAAPSSASAAPDEIASSSAPIILVTSSAAPVPVVSRAPMFALSSAPIAPVASSSVPPAVVSSEPASSTSSIDHALQARVTAMSKANVSPANWTQQYCSTHISFCIPVHKNWYYTSFGATSSSLWHVELSSEELTTIGDGPVSIVLSTGTAPAPDGQVTVEGRTVTGIRAWTQNRHFVISAPVSLEAAVRYITQELKAAPTASSSASAL